MYLRTMTLVLAAVWWTGTAATAETPWPLKTPAELKALHGPSFAGAQILTYRHSVEPHQPGVASETVIGIGRDFIFREEGKTRFVVDLRLGRIYQETNKRYVSYPMAANIVFWDSELTHRVALGKALATAGVAAAFDLFWAAVELKVTTPGDQPPALETRDDNGETVFSYKGEEALRWRPAGKPLPAESGIQLGHAFAMAMAGASSSRRRIISGRQGSRAPQGPLAPRRPASNPRLCTNGFAMVRNLRCPCR
jgi:hypothetical protein